MQKIKQKINQQNEAHNLYSTIMNALENNKDRYEEFCSN